MESEPKPQLSIRNASIVELVELALEVEMDRKRKASEPIYFVRDGEHVTLLPGDKGYYRASSPFDGPIEEMGT